MMQKIKSQKGSIVLIVVGIIAIALFGIGAGYFMAQKSEEEMTNQKQEQKIIQQNKQKEEIPDKAADWKTYRNEKYGFEVNYPDDLIIKQFREENCQLSGKVAEISFINSDIKISVDAKCDFEPFGNEPGIRFFPFIGFGTIDCTKIIDEIDRKNIIECDNVYENTRQIFRFYSIPNLLNIFSIMEKFTGDESLFIEAYYDLKPASVKEFFSDEFEQKRNEYINKIKNKNLSEEELKEIERVKQIQVKVFK